MIEFECIGNDIYTNVRRLPEGQLIAHKQRELKNNKNLYRIWLSIQEWERKRPTILSIGVAKGTEEEVKLYLECILLNGFPFASRNHLDDNNFIVF